jgi:hypothetical protein
MAGFGQLSVSGVSWDGSLLGSEQPDTESMVAAHNRLQGDPWQPAAVPTHNWYPRILLTARTLL